jgi:LysR family transcriptional activator of nhaA
VVLSLESGQLEGLLQRLTQHHLDVVLANESVPSEPDRPLHCQFLGSQAISLVGPANVWASKQLRIPEDLNQLDIALPGSRHAIRAQFDALCASAGVSPRLRAEVDDMAMLRLIARDSGWLAVLPEVVVQDELKSGVLVTVGQSNELQERFYAITTPRRHRIEMLETLIRRSAGGQQPADLGSFAKRR